MFKIDFTINKDGFELICSEACGIYPRMVDYENLPEDFKIALDNNMKVGDKLTYTSPVSEREYNKVVIERLAPNKQGSFISV
jgi:hypothetical protein